MQANRPRNYRHGQKVLWKDFTLDFLQLPEYLLKWPERSVYNSVVRGRLPEAQSRSFVLYRSQVRHERQWAYKSKEAARLWGIWCPPFYTCRYIRVYLHPNFFLSHSWHTRDESRGIWPFMFAMSVHPCVTAQEVPNGSSKHLSRYWQHFSPPYSSVGLVTTVLGLL